MNDQSHGDRNVTCQRAREHHLPALCPGCSRPLPEGSQCFSMSPRTESPLSGVHITFLFSQEAQGMYLLGNHRSISYINPHPLLLVLRGPCLSSDTPFSIVLETSCTPGEGGLAVGVWCFGCVVLWVRRYKNKTNNNKNTCVLVGRDSSSGFCAPTSLREHRHYSLLELGHPWSCCEHKRRL